MARVCLLIVAFGVIPETPVLIGANRDESLQRPTTLMTALSASRPRILGGRDEHSGGTWLAVNEYGVFGALTNQPLGESKDLTKRTRGELPLALASQGDATTAAQHLVSTYHPEDYNGSWLVVGDRHHLYYIDFTGLVPVEAIALVPGIHVFENKARGVASGKVDRVHELIGDIGDDADAAVVTFQKTLGDHWIPDMFESSADLPKVVPCCVHLKEYGTRSSCIVRISQQTDVLPQLLVADGPPCTAPYEDDARYWTADPT